MTRIREFVISSSNARYAKRARLLFTDCTRIASEGRGIQKGNAYNARANLRRTHSRRRGETLDVLDEDDCTVSIADAIAGRHPATQGQASRGRTPLFILECNFLTLSPRTDLPRRRFEFLSSRFGSRPTAPSSFPPREENACRRRRVSRAAESNVRGKRCSLGRAESVQDVVNNHRTIRVAAHRRPTDTYIR